MTVDLQPAILTHKPQFLLPSSTVRLESVSPVPLPFTLGSLLCSCSLLFREVFPSSSILSITSALFRKTPGGGGVLLVTRRSPLTSKQVPQNQQDTATERDSLSPMKSIEYRHAKTGGGGANPRRNSYPSSITYPFARNLRFRLAAKP